MRILFQGDSITDAGRDRSDPHHLGNGYPKYAAEILKEWFPDEELEFVNFGISGNRACDLVARWEAECLDWKPDIVSILIGINDTWRRYDANDITTAEQFEANYRKLLSDLREKTSATIVMLEQFLLPADPAKECWHGGDLDEKIQVTRRLAREFADVFVPLDGMLAAACVGQDPTAFSGDGVHPNEEGARLIGEWYADAVAPYIL
ncbi:MAG: GDSL family lipase [Ruminococcaceae bacterium]|nr:GDSL family lipase [Oscillospiraceae bacterium]